MSSAMRRSLPIVAVLLATAASRPAGAAPDGGDAALAPGDADEATRATARKIAEDGLSLFDAGKFAEALEHFTRAGALVRAPTMELMAARSLARLGRLVEAAQRFEIAAQMTLAADASDAFHKARVDARKEGEALASRIPSLSLVAGAGAAGATVTLDGKVVPEDQLGAPMRVDPGPHTVVVAKGDARATERVQLAEGDARSLSLSLGAPPPAPLHKMKIAGIAGIALGGVGLAVGAVAGGLAISTNSELEKVCKPVCPEAERGKVDGYETMKAVTTASLVAGSVLLGAGALLVGLSPSAPPPAASGARARPHVSPWIGAGTAGVRVDF